MEQLTSFITQKDFYYCNNCSFWEILQ